jgi:DNA-binding FadR family transcriptional regulator
MNDLPPLERNVPLAAQVAERIRARVESGEWAVGTRLPPEHQLSDQFGLSRNTVREALRALVHAGLLEARVGDGTYVRASSELLVTLDRRLRRSALGDVYEVRSMFEERGARLAASSATPAAIARVRTLLTARDSARDRGDADGYLDADLAFHDAVVEAGGNELLTDLYRHIAESVAATVAASAVDDGLGLNDPAHDDLERAHHRLLTAIESRDGAAAAAAAVSLVDESRRVSSTTERTSNGHAS